MVTYLLLAGLLVTLLPSTLATSLYSRDRQAFGLCYEEDCLSAHFSYNPYGCHGKVSSILHVHGFFFPRTLRIILLDDKGGIFIGHTCPIFSKTQKSFLKENLLKLFTTIGKKNHDYRTNF